MMLDALLAGKEQVGNSPSALEFIPTIFLFSILFFVSTLSIIVVDIYRRYAAICFRVAKIVKADSHADKDDELNFFADRRIFYFC